MSRAGAATVSLHQLRPLVAALIAGSRFKTMIYLIKPHFCIVSRAFVVVRPPIIPARPLHPARWHEIAIDTTAWSLPFSATNRARGSLRVLFTLSSWLLSAFLFFVNRAWSPSPTQTAGKSFPENHAQKLPLNHGNVTTCRNHSLRFDFAEFQSDTFVATIAKTDSKRRNKNYNSPRWRGVRIIQNAP